MILGGSLSKVFRKIPLVKGAKFEDEQYCTVYKEDNIRALVYVCESTYRPD